MSNMWILVAHRSGARLFENKGPGMALELIQDIPHPEGRLKNQELGSDKHGRAFDRQGQGRHAYEKEHSPSAHLAEQFAKHLSKLLDQGRIEHRYSKLVLVAEPRFLGNLRAALTPQTAVLISAALDKDLGEIKERDLPAHLADIVGL